MLIQIANINCIILKGKQIIISYDNGGWNKSYKKKDETKKKLRTRKCYLVKNFFFLAMVHCNYYSPLCNFLFIIKIVLFERKMLKISLFKIICENLDGCDSKCLKSLCQLLWLLTMKNPQSFELFPVFKGRSQPFNPNEIYFFLYAFIRDSIIKSIVVFRFSFYGKCEIYYLIYISQLLSMKCNVLFFLI